MPQIFITLAGILGGLSVAAGAFATHALKAKLSERAIEIFETAARYQMYHAIALLIVALLLIRADFSQSTLVVTGWAFIVGTILFSGSLYALSLTDIKVLGAITPLGGAAFILGWLCLAYAGFNFE
ncbi:DUF423 domain-containing protein [Aliterella atlantica]|uniref:DUF423 domain-containing protein n=1 Tax=Aliterella atlantica CENA595 TaxID=1618023 RepID=A0A0D8ZYN7_9CYAN|nr:DUF423 domain-containing protein [Aliterella atlantica]KJH72316.1 hypothetical protein UH38_07805 [Aliterella atlantica CENA595]